MELPSIAGWDTEMVRMTFFANEPFSAEGKNWWQLVTGSSPETVVSKPVASEHSESGPFGQGLLEMKASFNRVDWLYMPTFNPGVGRPSLGSARETLGELVDRLSSWMDSNPASWVRLAFGAVTLLKVDTTADANDVILQYMPFLQFDPEKARDVFIQINYPVDSEVVGELKVNKLSKFMAATAQFVNIGLGAMVPTFKVENFCRAEFDINTSGERSLALPGECVKPLAKELLDCCVEVLSSGVR